MRRETGSVTAATIVVTAGILGVTCVWLSACGGSAMSISVVRPTVRASGREARMDDAELRVSCVVVARDGREEPCSVDRDGNGWTIEHPLGHGARVVLRAPCLPEIQDWINGRGVRPGRLPAHGIMDGIRWDLRPPRQARVREPTTADGLGAAQDLHLDPGARVEVLSAWPDASGECGALLVRLREADASSAAYVLPGSTVEELSEEEVHAEQIERERAAAAAEEVAQREAAERARSEREAEERRAADARREADAVANAEVAAGACSAESTRLMDGADSGLDVLLRSAHLIPLRHERAVGSGAEARWTWRAPMTGTYHVLVGSWRPIDLTVDRAGGAATSESPFARLLVSRGWTAASRSFVADAGRTFDVTVSTRGCFAVYVYYELPR